jgi:pentatricopeptide repeat protein
VSPAVTAIAYLRILQLPKAFDCLLSVEDEMMDDGGNIFVLLVLAYCYQLVGKFEEAIQYCHKVQTLFTAAPDVGKRRDLLTALNLMMDIYVEQGLYHEAMKMYEQILYFLNEENWKENFSKEMLDFLNSSAVLLIKMEQYNKAESILRSIIDNLRNRRKNYFNYFMCLNNLAVVLLNQDKNYIALCIRNWQ